MEMPVTIVRGAEDEPCPMDARLRSWQRILRHVHDSQIPARSRPEPPSRRRRGAAGAQHHRVPEEPADEPVRGLSRRRSQSLLPRQGRRNADRADGIPYLQSAARARDALHRFPHRAHGGHALGAVRAARQRDGARHGALLRVPAHAADAARYSRRLCNDRRRRRTGFQALSSRRAASARRFRRKRWRMRPSACAMSCAIWACCPSRPQTTAR